MDRFDKMDEIIQKIDALFVQEDVTIDEALTILGEISVRGSFPFIKKEDFLRIMKKTWEVYNEQHEQLH